MLSSYLRNNGEMSEKHMNHQCEYKENVKKIHLVRVNKIPFRRTKRVQKYLYVSCILDAPVLGLASTPVPLVASFASPFPLPLPVDRTEDSLTARALTSPES